MDLLPISPEADRHSGQITGAIARRPRPPRRCHGRRVGAGAAGTKLTAYAISGLSIRRPGLGRDSGQFFGSISSLSWIRSGFEAEEPKLQKIQDEALAKRSPAVRTSLLKTPPGPVAFTHVRAFLDGDHFAEDQTVVVDKGVITLAGPAAQVRVPLCAQTIDGKGKTLVPVLWDSHMHFADDASGPMLLSLGITPFRDPGNIHALTLARAARREKANCERTSMPRCDRRQGAEFAQVASVAHAEEALAIIIKPDRGFSASNSTARSSPRR